MLSFKEWRMYFEGPSKGQIKKNNREIKESFRDIDELLSVIICMNNNEFIYTPKDFKILPKNKWGEEISPDYFKKRYKTIHPLMLTENNCIENQVMPQQKFLKEFKKFYGKSDIDFSRRGMSWIGKDGIKRVTLFYDLYLGWKLSLVSLANYNEIRSSRIINNKTSSIVSVPSKSNPHIIRNVNLYSLPVTKKNNKYCAEWLNLNIESTSPREKYNTKEIIFSPEKIAAYIIRGIQKEGVRVIKENEESKLERCNLEGILANPFMAPTENLVKIINKLENNVLRCYEIIKKDGTKEESYRKLNQAEKTNLISWAIHFLYLYGEESFIHNESFKDEFINEVAYILPKLK